MPRARFPILIPLKAYRDHPQKALLSGAARPIGLQFTNCSRIPSMPVKQPNPQAGLQSNDSSHALPLGWRSDTCETVSGVEDFSRKDRKTPVVPKPNAAMARMVRIQARVVRSSCMLFLSVRGFSDYAGPTVHSRLGCLPCCLPPTRNEVGILVYGLFAVQLPRPPMPLSTLHKTPRDVPCKTRGQDGFATSFPVN